MIGILKKETNFTNAFCEIKSLQKKDYFLRRWMHSFPVPLLSPKKQFINLLFDLLLVYVLY